MKLYLALLLGFASLAHAQKPAPFVLKGTLPTVKGTAQVFMRREGLFNGGITDSATIKNGAFELQGTLDAPTKARLVLVQNGKKRRMFTGQADNAVFYLEKGTTVFTSPDSLTHAKVTGSALSVQYQELAALLKPSRLKLKALYTEYRATPAQQRTAPAFQKQFEAREKELEDETKALEVAYVKAHPATLVSLNAVQDIGGPVPNYATIAPLFNSLAVGVRSTPEGKAYETILLALKRVAIGAPAPDFTLTTPDGKSVALSSYRGKYVLVDFWASWCGPCREENPNVAKVYEAYKGRNFEVLGVSIDVEKNRNQWVKAIKDDNLSWTQVSDLKQENAAAKLYSVQAIPQNFLIDPSGKIVATNLRGGELSSTIANLIPQ